PGPILERRQRAGRPVRSTRAPRSPVQHAVPTARSVSRAVSAAGAVFVLAGAGWDLLLRHPYRLGADQLALLAVGIALVGCARYLRTPRATARVERLIAASLGRTAAFEAELVRHPTLYLRAGVWLGFCLGLAESA